MTTTTTRREARPTLTPEAARSFERHSTKNATILSDAAALRGCGCKPYKDWFTFKRWLAQDRCVQKGQKGTKLSVIITMDKDADDGTVTQTRRPWRSSVFCRCQTAEKEAKDAKQ